MRIVSGGQTGADRAALDAALELGLEAGGWVPLGRQAEDGIIPERFPNLQEAESELPAVRTELNVRDSDATVIFSHGDLTNGSALTELLARKLAKPLLHLDLDRISEVNASAALRDWLIRQRPGTLNVAGPRESEDYAIHAATKRVLIAALGEAQAGSKFHE
jgi:hypothetical protein